MLKLDEPFRDQEIFYNLFFTFPIWDFKVKNFFLQFLVKIFPLDPDPGRQNLGDPKDPDPKH